MAIGPNTGAEITLIEGQELTAEFNKIYPDEAKAFFIGRNQLAKILSQEDCIGIRIYNGYDATAGTMSQVLVGVDLGESDMTSGVILDRMGACPGGACDSSSPLMT